MSIIKIRDLFRTVALASVLLVAGGVGFAYANVSVDGSNDTTGPNSENENEWNISRDIDIDIENTAEAENDFDIDVETGRNEIAGNTEVGDVETGDIWGDIVVETELNNAEIDLGELGDLGDVEVTLANEITGAGSDNENEVNIFGNVDIDVNNRAEIENDFDILANTGNNRIGDGLCGHCGGNTIVGDVRTGDIRFSADITNMANQNMGSVDLSGLGGMDVSADLSNSITGPCSSNENELNVENDVDVDIENNAEIENDVDVDANTGNNLIGGNTVVGDITTGDVEINFSAVNSAN